MGLWLTFDLVKMLNKRTKMTPKKEQLMITLFWKEMSKNLFVLENRFFVFQINWEKVFMFFIWSDFFEF